MLSQPNQVVLISLVQPKYQPDGMKERVVAVEKSIEGPVLEDFHGVNVWRSYHGLR
jgi:hypothetical protein